MSLNEKVKSAIADYSMLDGVSRVIVALSGGADSMSLLHFLTENSEKYNIQVEAAHLNHCLRGEEAVRDENFVASYCRRRDIRIYIRREDIRSLAEKRGMGLEECGREARYDFFRELRGGDTKCVIATAHTASDNAETVLFNLTRGCGLSGLAGIPAVREGVVRPLIYCTRGEIEEYCGSNGIDFVTDSTNREADYSRNKLRLNVIPVLREINPSAETAINRLSALARDDLRIIRSVAEQKLAECQCGRGLSISSLNRCARELLPHILRLFICKELELVPERRHIELIMNMVDEGSGALFIKKNRCVRVSHGVLLCERSSGLPQEFEEIPFRYPYFIKYNGKKYVFSDKKNDNSANQLKINKKLVINRVSCDIISCDTKIRCRKSGDVFAPFGRGCTKSVKKLFCEMKLPAEERATRLLIANGSRVLWIEGVGVSQDAAPRADEQYFEVEVNGE